MAKDSAGNLSIIYTVTYEIDTIAPSAPVILSENNPQTIASPYPTFNWSLVDDADSYTLQLADNPDFINLIEVADIRTNAHSLMDPLTDYGTWHWQVKAVDTAGNESNWRSSQFDYEQETLVHKAIIVAGSGPYPENALWPATEMITISAYKTLHYQGYTQDNIQYLSDNTTLDIDEDESPDVDGNATKNELQQAITVWATDADDLFLYLTGQLENGLFILDGTNEETETLSPEELNSWLDTLQEIITGKVIVISDFCESGKYLPFLTPQFGKDRIVITATSANESACFMKDGTLSFSYQFWASVIKKADLYDAYLTGKNMLKIHQASLLDSNGDGIPNQKDDQQLALDITIGYGRVSASTPPIIHTVTGNQFVQENASANFRVSNIESMNRVESVWGIITPPETNNLSQEEPIIDLPVIELTDPDYDDIYEGSYDGFNIKGIYTISIHAMDSERLYSMPVITRVIKDVVIGDINGDEIVDIADAIIDIKINCGMETAGDKTYETGDINWDGKIGLEEVIYILQDIAEK